MFSNEKNLMKKIACVGYHYTGAGVIDDLFRECDNVAQGPSEAESIFLQHTDGILDLEYHLVENPHRTGSSIAIDRFLKYVKEYRRMYEKIYGKQWLSLCTEYIYSISKFEFEGYCFPQLFLRKPYLKYIMQIFFIVNKFIPPRYRIPKYYNFFPHEKSFHAYPSQEEFIEKTKIFLDKLCNQIPINDKTEFILLDQLVAGNNPSSYLKFIDNLKVFVVDRDPRDMYIYHHSRHDHMLPKDPYQFCIHYKDIRERHGEIDEKKVMYISFEDMIYSYDKMKNKIFEFVGMDINHHISPRKYFDPNISIKNTKLWESNLEYGKQVAIIEKELPQFLHHYE